MTTSNHMPTDNALVSQHTAKERPSLGTFTKEQSLDSVYQYRTATRRQVVIDSGSYCASFGCTELHRREGGRAPAIFFI